MGVGGRTLAVGASPHSPAIQFGEPVPATGDGQPKLRAAVDFIQRTPLIVENRVPPPYSMTGL